MDFRALIEDLRAAPWYRGQIEHTRHLPQRQAQASALESPLHHMLKEALTRQGITSLYSHQAEAINALQRGHHVIVSTPSASGKSLCYHLPVLNTLLGDNNTCAVYLFPAKALAQDQLRGLGKLVSQESKINTAVYDGDTPSGERATARKYARILLTNPDMLHVGILPNHKAWSRLLRGLRYVVVDEAHVYRGVFGSNVACLLRRLRRICRLYGSSPQFVLCSATIANPRELAEQLTGIPFKVVDQDGSSYGGKHFVFWNPPIVDQAKLTRRSASSETARLFAEIIRRRMRTLAFVRTRRLAELVYVYARDELTKEDPDLARRISPYRGSYLPEDRRRIESALSSGELLGVSATNALELGIDIGDLEATLISGYPGSISATWQQAGRSGRRGQESVSILVAQSNPLDQYFMRHPEAFFGKQYESAIISPENPYVLRSHLLCAAYEMPLSARDAPLFGETFAARVGEMTQQGVLRPHNGRWHLSPQLPYPAEEVSLRSSSPDCFLVVDEAGRVLEKVEGAAALAQLHPGATYLHQGEPFLVKDLDLTSKTAYVTATPVSYYTQSHDITDIRVLDVKREKFLGDVEVYLGHVEISNQVVSFRKTSHLTDEVLGEEYLDLPPSAFRTVAMWFDIPPGVLAHIAKQRLDLAGGLHAAEHAAIGVLPLFALCDRADIGGVSTPLHPDTGKPQVFIYDGHPGGIGITERGYEIIEQLWSTTLEVVSECPCQDGCPSCIQSPKCGNNNHPLDKQVATMVLRALLGYENISVGR